MWKLNKCFILGPTVTILSLSVTGYPLGAQTWNSINTELLSQNLKPEYQKQIAQATSKQELGKRVALIIGNADYQEVGKLKNPLNDAKDMAAALKDLGFDVILLTNV